MDSSEYRLDTYRKEVHFVSRKNMFLSITLGPGSFKNFAVFDAMTKHRKWKTSMSIGAAGVIGGFIAFMMQEMWENMFLLGVFLMVLGMFVPSMYFKNFYASIKDQTAKMNIEKPRHVYSIELGSDPDGIIYYHPKEKKPAGKYSWSAIDSVWRTDKAIYLYVDAQRALLVPDNSKNVTQDEVWNFVRSHAKSEKLHDERGKKQNPFNMNLYSLFKKSK